MISLRQFSTLLTAILICIASLTTVHTALAATHLVTPMVVNLTLEKRDIVTEYVTLTNTSNRMVRVYASVNNVAMNGGVVESFVQKVTADRTNTATTWIEISRKRIELTPGEVREVPFTVRMNPQIEPGDYNVFIGFAEGSNRPTAEAKVANGDAPGTIIHIAVDQTQDQFLRLTKFFVDTFVNKPDEETMTFTLTNPGGVDIVPKGEVIFYDNSGDEVGSLPVNTTEKLVPADGETVFTIGIPETLPLGKYKAFLSVEYGDHLTASIHDTVFFYITPLKEMIIIFVSILVFAIIITLLVHHRFKARDNHDGSENVAMYIREGHSEDQHHDINLIKKDDE